MIPARRSVFPTGMVLLLGQLLLPLAATAESMTPHDWLSRMGAAVQTTSYEGTVIRIRDGNSEALKVIHTIMDGVVREKVVALEGSGLEIIRNGNEVHCILPDKKSVLVEVWDDQSTLFSTLPSSDIRFGNEYDVAIIREDRIAGRPTVELAIRPHDAYRYGHRLWLDTETGFPLQTQLISEGGAALEEVKFVDISLNQEIEASALAPSYSIDNFLWLTQPERHSVLSVETAWESTELPQGFRAVATHAENLPGNDQPVTHILYSDGLANVSVFIAAQDGEGVEGASSVGRSNTYSVVVADHQVTAVGEVPAITVQQIATAMRPR